MSTVTANYSHGQTVERTKMSAADQVQTILRYTFGLVPIVAGADKFSHLLVNWDQYLAPSIANAIPMAPHSFMLIVGVIEIVAGILVLVRPRIGSIVVCIWVLGIVIKRLLAGQYYDVAVRDAVMAISAYSLHTLSKARP
jgi:uncharacterized membrane protein YphA (DoxX/SURF4 family)